MRSNDVIYLMKNTTEYDEIGNAIHNVEERMVFANKYQVSISEFYSENINYQAEVHTIRDKKSFQIRALSYQGEERFKYKGKVYDIIRASDNGEYYLIVGVEKIGKR